jgi:hypothetical protein
VKTLTDLSRLHISAIPPALSEIGPYPSIARQTGKHPSIPRAARATPYIAAQLKASRTVTDKQQIGMILERYPRARPLMIFVAAS